MMQKGKARNMFPGGNTSKGFYSRFDNIISPEEARRIFVIKGGPGTGKSTLMKNISEIMTDHGYDVELMHCSSDSKSLDGVVVPELRVALIDGTAPHVTDPKAPGAVDEIINLGEYWSEEAIAGNRTRIMKISNEIKVFFQRAYRYLKAAYLIYEDSSALYGSVMNRAGLSSIAGEFSGILFDALPFSDKPGRQRCLFASAITPDGPVSYVDDLLTLDNIYILEGFPGSGTDIVLERIKTAAVERGFDVEAFYCGFDPDRLEHLIIPELNTGFSTAGKYHSTDACAVRRVDFRQLLDDGVISVLSQELDYNGHEFDRLLDKAVKMISNAKKLHDELEACYMPHMDFEGIKKKQDEIVQRILGYK
jgi:hypothetical protein